MDSAVLLRSEAELVINEVCGLLHISTIPSSVRQARRQKSERTKNLGLPIQLVGKALDIHIEGNEAWIAENTHVAKKIDLEASSLSLTLNSRRIATPVR